MAITTTTTQEVTVIGVDSITSKRPLPEHDSSSSSSSSSSQSILSCDDSTCASLSSDDSKPRRRRRATRRKKKAGSNNRPQHQQQQQQPELSLEEENQYVALDCEMVGVGYRGNKSSVARVTLVGWNGQVLFDEFIQQDCPVIDYRTFVSGITAEDLETATWTLEDCQEHLLELLTDKTLIGHALKNDLKALAIQHPWQLTRDTAKYEPFQQLRFDDNVLWPRKLKDLVKEKFQMDIQVDGQPHSPYEDAMAALELYRMSRRKWEKAMDYKIKKTEEIEQRNQKRASQ